MAITVLSNGYGHLVKGFINKNCCNELNDVANTNENSYDLGMSAFNSGLEVASCRQPARLY